MTGGVGFRHSGTATGYAQQLPPPPTAHERTDQPRSSKSPARCHPVARPVNQQGGKALRFPWRNGNDAALLINGENFYPAILDAIATAEHSVRIEMYLVASGEVAGRFIKAWTDAARRGVRIELLFDAFGALGLSSRDRRRLQASGVRLAFYNPLRLNRSPVANLTRTHRKLVLVDDRLVFVGGAGITDDFIGHRAWRETMVQVRGPVVSDWLALFLHNWQHWAKGDGANPLPAPKPFEKGGMRGRVACNRGEKHGEIKRSLLRRLRCARQRVELASAYFVPSRKVRKELRRLAQKGVDVRLLLPGPVTDHPAVRHASHRYYARLLRHGVRIFEYQESFMHTKVILIDDWSSIGSSNLDRWNLHWNLEANQEIDDAGFADKVARMFRDDEHHSREITYEAWRQRSTVQQLKERFWGSIDLWSARWSNRRRITPPPQDDDSNHPGPGQGSH